MKSRSDARTDPSARSCDPHDALCSAGLLPPVEVVGTDTRKRLLTREEADARAVRRGVEVTRNHRRESGAPGVTLDQLVERNGLQKVLFRSGLIVRFQFLYTASIVILRFIQNRFPVYTRSTACNRHHYQTEEKTA